jgi:DNA-binding CsgD family transcriptional regulator
MGVEDALEVAAVLNISLQTVESHKYRMTDQLKAKSGPELIQYALKYGLVSI